MRGLVGCSGRRDARFADRHPQAVKRLTLALLAVAGLCSVSIPVTIALVLSGTQRSDVLRPGDPPAAAQLHPSPATALAPGRCTATRGTYALTFDDGPLPGATPRLVAALRRAGAVAVFFDVGARAAARPDLVELQRTVGQVAGHGYSHAPLARVSSARRVQELQQTAAVLDHPNAFFRAPAGATSPALDADVRRSGLTPVSWTVDTGDLYATARDVVRAALRVAPGGIVRLHEGAPAASAAVPRIVAGLRRRGLCPGLLAVAPATVIPATGNPFHAPAVQP
jgi:peptidoglycan/xylan/chitin deacetylase (PgdA/CDA1 family)